jgi:hypothetical protein
MTLSNTVLIAAASLSAATYACSALVERAETSELNRLSHLPGGDACNKKVDAIGEGSYFCPRQTMGSGAGVACTKSNAGDEADVKGAIIFTCTNTPAVIPTKSETSNVGIQEELDESRPECPKPDTHHECLKNTAGIYEYRLINATPSGSCGTYRTVEYPQNRTTCGGGAGS